MGDMAISKLPPMGLVEASGGGGAILGQELQAILGLACGQLGLLGSSIDFPSPHDPYEKDCLDESFQLSYHQPDIL